MNRITLEDADEIAIWCNGTNVYCRIPDESFGDSYVVWALKDSGWEVAGDASVIDSLNRWCLTPPNAEMDTSAGSLY